MSEGTKSKEKKNKLSDLQEIESRLKRFTGHNNVKLVARANFAILAALQIVKRVNPKPFVLIPDQGGWISYETYPKMFGFQTKVIKTNRGVIDLIDLGKKAESGAALLMSSFAGWFAEQPLKYISKICKEHNCILIEDASGSLGDKTLCNGEHSDIILGSFGRWKPINLGYGGFISVKNDDHFSKGKEIFSATNFYPEYKKLIEKLDMVEKKLELMLKLQDEVKSELEELNIKVLHKNLRGPNVIAKPIKSEDREKIIKYCDDNQFEYVECPKYIRVEEDAISIELKRLEFEVKKK